MELKNFLSQGPSIMDIEDGFRKPDLNGVPVARSHLGPFHHGRVYPLK